MSFSSYAGYLVSLDDFYIMDRYMITHRKHNFFWEKMEWAKYMCMKNLTWWHLAFGLPKYTEVYRSIKGGQVLAGYSWPTCCFDSVAWWCYRQQMTCSTPHFWSLSPQILSWPGTEFGWQTWWLTVEKNGQMFTNSTTQVEVFNSVCCLGAELQCCESIHLGLQGFLGTKELLMGKYYLILG